MNASDAGKINNFHEKNFGDQANNNEKQITMLHNEDSQRRSLNRKYLAWTSAEASIIQEPASPSNATWSV